MLIYKETEVIELRSDFLTESGVRVWVKREDQNHPHVSGNKWWKLKYNLEDAVRQGHTTLLTFGGAYSNHIYSTAAAGHDLGMKSIGIIRGEHRMTSTLSFASQWGMQLQHITREAYRKKTEDEFIEGLKKTFGEFYLIPEGGTNELALKGCLELAAKINELDFDCLCLPVGTGGTLAGLAAGLYGKKILGYSTLKGGEFLKDEVTELVRPYNQMGIAEWAIENQYHFGGYGKSTPELDDFIVYFEKEFGIPVEHVYMGKMMFGLFDGIRRGRFPRGTRIVALHTGGLQAKVIGK